MSSPVVEIWDVSRLIPYEHNAKVHTPEQVKKLAQAIRTFGWTQPIVVWENGEIIAGHGRRLAALDLGLAKVPVIVRDDLTKAEADALRLADNRVTSTEYDQAAIQVELARLNEELSGTDIMSAMGFDAKELDFAMADLGEIDEGFFAEDLSTEVEAQRVKNENGIAQTDETAAPVGDALGFKRVTVTQSRALRTLMQRVEIQTSSTGVEALLKFLANHLGEAA